ncbi:MAG: hypothetical protein ACKVOW_03755 [Chitinophagaceae bacterium]
MKKQFYLFGLLLFPFFIEAQNIGIGTTTPSARLQINHRSFTTIGLQLLDSFPSRAGSIRFSTINNPVGMTISSFYESPFNKGHYLDINSDTAFIATFRGNGNVGLGVESPLYRLDINGDINTNGLLRLSGNAGTTGQVLTSNGAADPTWTDASFGNNVRFAVSFTGDLSALPTVSTYTTIYNLSPPDISIGVNSITINKSGLYHIEGYSSVTAGSSTPPTLLFAIISMIYDGIIINYAEGDPLYSTTTGCCTYKRTFHYSQDIYLTAPAVISPEASIVSNITMTPRLFSGKITAYLINE